MSFVTIQLLFWSSVQYRLILGASLCMSIDVYWFLNQLQEMNADQVVFSPSIVQTVAGVGQIQFTYLSSTLTGNTTVRLTPTFITEKVREAAIEHDCMWWFQFLLSHSRKPAVIWPWCTMLVCLDTFWWIENVSVKRLGLLPSVTLGGEGSS